MFFAADLATVTNAIQLAVAPVFLLTAVSGMIGTGAGRLTRIIDRARILEDRLASPAAPDARALVQEELARLRRRGRLVNACIALLTFCAILIGLTIMVLFLGETGDRIAGKDIAPERHHQGLGAKARNALQRQPQCVLPGTEVRAPGQGQVAIESKPRSGTPLIGIAQEKMVLAVGVAVEAGKKHVGAFVKNGLGSIAVVIVNIQNRHTLETTVPQLLRRQRRVVQKTIAPEKVRPGMVAGWSRQGKSGTLALR